jgi:hypothetical protein
VISPGLFCVALLLATPLIAQQGASPAAPITDMKVECLPASRGSELIGKHGCVAGKVFRISTLKSGAVHLSLCPPKKQCSFHTAVSEHDRETVGDLYRLQGKFVAFVGDVVEYRNHPQLIVHSREQIHVTAGNPPPEFDAAQSKPNSKSTPGNKRDRAW